MGEQTGTGRYMYAVCRGLDPAVLERVTGLHDRTLELVGHDQLAAVVSTVPLEEFGEEGLRRNLEDLSWLEPVVRTHDDVIHAVAVEAPTAPLRLATICLDDNGVRARLREWYAPLTQALDRVAGRAEWSVKVLTRPNAPGAQGTSGAEEAGPATGADYLRRKKEQAQRRASGDAEALEVARRVHDELAGHAAASRQLQPQDSRLSGHQGTMVLNAAYLVPVEESEAFAARVADLQAAHADVLIDGRGPWPPYSFAMLEQR